MRSRKIAKRRRASFPENPRESPRIRPAWGRPQPWDLREKPRAGRRKSSPRESPRIPENPREFPENPRESPRIPEIYGNRKRENFLKVCKND